VNVLWDGPDEARPDRTGPPPGDVDVVVVGAGYTGLWTAHSLLGAEPGIRVAIVERERAGFGASGRNGGWCVGELAGGLAGWVRSVGREPAVRMTHAVIDTVDHIGATLADEGIDCGFVKGGVVRLARNAAQLRRQRDEVEHMRAHGFGADVLEPLDAGAATERLHATGVLGGLFYAPCARVHPGRLVRGLADAVERRGATIHEGCEVVAIDADGRSRPAVRTVGGEIRADVVVRATEGYTRDLPGHRRDLVPLYSLMIATEPIPVDMWAEIGLERCETFSDDRHMVIYGQRTVDDRIAFGGRGAPYAWGSGIDPARESSVEAHAHIHATLVELLPSLRSVAITHRWGGVLGVPRRWRASVCFDRHRGVATAGGYVGEGVAASNLAGRTLADLILGHRTELTSLPWVDRPSRRWEPEPLRWLGIRASLVAMSRADRIENAGGESTLASAVSRLIR
jgi:glycine/D-amino acid oxidase-like deaminating enzyme